MKESWDKPHLEKVYFDLQDSILLASGDTPTPDPTCRSHCATICHSNSCSGYDYPICTINCTNNNPTP